MNSKISFSKKKFIFIILFVFTFGSMQKTFTEGKSAVNTVAFSPNGELIAVGSDDGTAKVYNMHTGKMIFKVTN